jgi:organic hydroperoxide reductase OsmC/OhrA
MATHTAKIEWTRNPEEDFAKGRYSRGHLVIFDGGVSIPGSSSPSVVHPPYSVLAAADPEEMLIASLSSCHMLTFLDLARRAGFVVDSYIDKAEGGLVKNEKGHSSLGSVTLRPEILFAGAAPSAEQLTELHHKSHELCFIANSVNFPVLVE